MRSDQLSEVFDVIQVRGVLSGGFAACGPWVSRGALQTPLKFFALVSGRARLSTDGLDSPLELEPGDVLFFHCRLFHAAGANSTTHTKYSAVFTYHAADNRPLPGTRSASLPEVALPA